MSYITSSKLIIRMGARELALVTGGKLDLSIEPEPLKAVIEASDTQAFSAEEIEDATAAKTLVESTILDASNLINGYISERLPLSEQLINDSALPSICYKLAKHDLFITADEQATDDKKDAMQQLRDIAKGLVSLGQEDPQARTSPSTLRVAASNRPSITDGF
ncbi:phage protein Gp36 family protein [Colwellia psychrerythraea]|uniref:Mu-like prophage FluMu protein gp36 n=1 Tax=Colwellia psychrerythraea TaxID=28229 RepID=A0A099KQJ0_COLPS|nr:phage protein Gp36 family protein [Colwellia psychrerythraea]KGJ92127.1 protein of unknown function DUF1320 [Colwellia psychrerythraea]